jgi:acyl dehydratase
VSSTPQAVAYEVGREKVREYAAAIGETTPIHFDPEAAADAGYAGVVAPPMFCAVYCAPAMARVAFDPALGIDRARLVHGEQTFVWSEPVCAGDIITTAAEVVRVYAKGSNAFYEFASVSTNQRGEETVRGRYTGIVRDGAAAVGDTAPASASGAHADAGSGGGSPPHGLSAGDALPVFRVTPDKYLPYRYAGASGDFTPIHIDAEFARSVGLPGIILHGFYTMAIVARAQIGAGGGDPRGLRRLSVRFQGVGVPETEIEVSGRVREISDRSATIEIRALQAGEEIVGKAEAELVAPVS